MKTKPVWHSIIVTGLVVLLASSFLMLVGCGNKAEIEEPEVGPLEPPFSEIIPSADELPLLGTIVTEETIYYPDGSIAYCRTFANEAANSVDYIEGQVPLLYNMLIYDYCDEEQAIQKKLKRKVKSSLLTNTGLHTMLNSLDYLRRISRFTFLSLRSQLLIGFKEKKQYFLG